MSNTWMIIALINMVTLKTCNNAKRQPIRKNDCCQLPIADYWAKSDQLMI